MKVKIRWQRILLIVLFFTLVQIENSAAGFSVNFKINLTEADLTLVGEDNGDWTAYFASPAGDVNGDGLGDALIGAPMAGNKICPYPPNEDGSCPGLPKGEGVAYLVLGKPKQGWSSNILNLADADASFVGCETTSMTARQLYTAGDVNGDGYDDILVSGWKCGTNYTGKTYLFLGRPDVSYWGRFYPVEQADASFLGENEQDFSSYYTSTADDVNGDGYDDILITSTHNDEAAEDAGKVYLILGRPEADWGLDYPLSSADASFVGEAAGDRLGRSATGVADVNGDGYGDFIIGSISSDYAGIDAGQNYLFLGRATTNDPNYEPDRPWWGTSYSVAGADASFVGEAEGDESGRRVASAGDVNGDGYSDILIGAALNDQGGLDSGITHLILGRPAADWGMRFPLVNADASFVGEVNLDQAGRRVNGAGDVNNDGYSDFIIGAPHNEEGGTLAGAAYLIYGRSAADWGKYFPLFNAPVKYIGKPEIGAAGYDMAGLGDFDGDQIDDFLIAAYGGRNNDNVPGEAYILSGTKDEIKLVQVMPDSPAGSVHRWARFTGDFWEPSGSKDIEEVYLVLAEITNDPFGLVSRFVQAENRFYLKDSNTSGWIASCSQGELFKINNGIVELDCKSSSVFSSGDTLRVMWRVRWLAAAMPTREFGIYLRARDVRGGDTGYVYIRTWLLKNFAQFMPVVSKKE